MADNFKIVPIVDRTYAIHAEATGNGGGFWHVRDPATERPLLYVDCDDYGGVTIHTPSGAVPRAVMDHVTSCMRRVLD